MGVIFFQKKIPPVKGKKGYCYSKSLGIFKQILGDFCAWAYSKSAFSFNLRLCLMLQVIMFIRSKMRIRTSLFGQKSVLHGNTRTKKALILTSICCLWMENWCFEKWAIISQKRNKDGFGSSKDCIGLEAYAVLVISVLKGVLLLKNSV